MDTKRVKIDDVEYHTRSPRYYRCSNCAHEQDRKCLAKPGNKDVRLNKKRNHCKKFQLDEEKFSAAEMKLNPIPIQRRPDWYWMTKQQKKRLAELLEGAMVVPNNTTIQRPSEKLIWTPGDAIDDYEA